MKTIESGIIIISIYVDDLLVTKINAVGTQATKDYGQKYLKIRDLGTLDYFLGLKFAYQHGNLAMTQWNYTLKLLQESGHKLESSPMVAHPQL